MFRITYFLVDCVAIFCASTITHIATGSVLYGGLAGVATGAYSVWCFIHGMRTAQRSARKALEQAFAEFEADLRKQAED